MALADDFRQFQADAVATFAAAGDAASVEAARIAWLGRQGRLQALQEAFRAAPGEEKRQLGPVFNAAKTAVESALRQAQERTSQQGDGETLDVTLPVPGHRPGTMHPLTRLGREVERVFSSMGFTIHDGPHAESEDYNFTRLNIPQDHPARDAQDTFWLTDGRCLRTHTSSVQSRLYELVGQGRAQVPLRAVAVGRVFRYEAVDATHDNTFTQVEGFVVDEGITISDLVGTLTTMLKALIGRDDVEVRLRPAYYPFVEPGFDVDIRSPSAPEGVRYRDWMELLGCGMIHPQVLANGGIDPQRWNGFAFGLGLERLAMVRHGIADIRVFHGGDLRTLQQFHR